MAENVARPPLAAMEPNTMTATLILKPKRKRPTKPIEIEADTHTSTKACSYFFPSRSYLPKSEAAVEESLMPMAYTELVDELDDMPSDYEAHIEDLRTKHETAVEVLSSLQSASQSKNKKSRITSQKLDAMLQMKILYEYIIAITNTLPAEEDALGQAELKENLVVKELVSITSRIKIPKVSAASRVKRGKRPALVDDEAVEEEAEEPAQPRKKRKCNEGKKAANAEGSEGEAEDEDESADEKAAIKAQQKQLKVFESIRQDSEKAISLDQDQIDSMQEQAGQESLEHLRVSYPDLGQFEQSLLSLIFPKLKSLEISITDRREEDPAPPVQMVLQLQSANLQLAFSTPTIHLSKSDVSEISSRARGIAARATDAASVIKQPDQAAHPTSPIEYAFSTHSNQSIQGLQQLIGTMGMLDGIMDSKGSVVKDIVPWLAEQLKLHYSSTKFSVHPLADLRNIKTIAGLSPTALNAATNANLIANIRKALVELANNVSKAVALLAGFGLGATSSPLWLTLCRPGSAILRSSPAYWQLHSTFSLLLELKEASQINLPSAFSVLVDKSPVTAAAVDKWKKRLQIALDTRDIKQRGKLSFSGKTIVGESEEDGAMIYKVAMASPNIILAVKDIPAKSKLLAEWSKRSAAEKRRFAEYEASLLENDEDEEGTQGEE